MKCQKQERPRKGSSKKYRRRFIMYYSLINNIRYESEITINEPKSLPLELSFISGRVISIPIETPMVFTTDGKKGDILRDFLRGSITLVSKRFLDILQGAGVDNLQTFPAIVKSTVDGSVWNDYFAVNVLGMIACADLNKSTYSEIMPGYYKFEDLAIDANKAKGALLFRLHEHTPTIMMHFNVGKYISSQDPDKTLKGWSVKKAIQ